jgi:hypothetical protein
MNIREKGAMLEVKKLAVITNHSPDYKEDAVNAGWANIVQGYPVIPELETLLLGFFKGMPNAKIFPKILHTRSTDVGRLSLAVEVYVYLEDCPLTLGAMGWKDYAVGRTHYGYGVTSRKITNEKYAPHRDQYHVALSDSVDKSVKNALKYIRPFTHQELASVYYENMQDQVRTHKGESAGRLRGVVATLTNHAVLYEELAYLNNLGIQFKTSEFQYAASKIQELAEEARIDAARKVDGIFVHVRTVGEDRYVDVITAGDVAKNYHPTFDSAGLRTYSIEELPHDIASKVSTLSILEDYGYVPRIGQKIDGYTYWVEQDKDNMYA